MAIKVQVIVMKDGEFQPNLFAHVRVSAFTSEECLEVYPTVGTVNLVISDVITVVGGIYTVIFVKQAFVK
jgi:hypothetical protein